MDDQIGFFLAGYPDGIVAIGQRLRRLVHRAMPGAQERLRSGWALIGFDIPLGKRRATRLDRAGTQAHPFGL